MLSVLDLNDLSLHLRRLIRQRCQILGSIHHRDLFIRLLLVKPISLLAKLRPHAIIQLRSHTQVVFLLLVLKEYQSISLCIHSL